jgi:bacterioferritin
VWLPRHPITYLPAKPQNQPDLPSRENAMQGDQQIIDILNELLAGELTAVDQYLIHGELYSDMGFARLAAKALHESAHELVHARALIQRILFLEGTPNLAKREALKIGKTVAEMLKSDLAVEYKVVGELRKAMAACEKALDYVSREMLAVQLEDTEMDHAYFLEKQIRLIELIGLPNYQQSQMASGTPS